MSQAFATSEVELGSFLDFIASFNGVLDGLVGRVEKDGGEDGWLCMVLSLPVGSSVELAPDVGYSLVFLCHYVLIAAPSTLVNS